MEQLDATAYLTSPGFTDIVRDRLEGVLEVHDRLLLAAGPPQRAWFVRNTWLEPVRIPIKSISDGARALRSMQRNWALYSTAHHRRATLIEEKLPHVSARPIEFPTTLPAAPLGSWTLTDRDCILASPRCTHPSPNGEMTVVEDRAGPPSRAYLKLQEALTLLGVWPGPGDRCLDAGCSPGGWTWVLARLGANVVAVDRAPLEPRVDAMPGVEFREGSAFSNQPTGDAAFDWIFSDVICYPERLYEWVRRWVESGRCANFVCTIKFQGDDPYDVVERFAAIPGSRIQHLQHNKHELTWMRLAP